MKIQFVKHNEIDKVRWDKCLSDSEPSLVYANSWYLDAVSPGWNGLVIDDYKAIFPLPTKKKLGLSYSHQPLFAQQLGLFSIYQYNIEESLVLENIPGFILHLRLFLNHKHEEGDKGYSKRLNHILPLKDLTEIEAGFNQNTKRNIKKALANDLELRTGIDIDKFVAFKKENSVFALSDDAWAMMKRLINNLIEHNCGEFVGAYKGEELVSAILLCNYGQRLTYLFSASSVLGKEERASFYLVYEILKKYAGSGKILDFEGSMDSNISRFFKGFGAVEEIYYEYRRGILA